MIVNVYSIRDVKSGFLTPTFEMSDEVAIRNFTHGVSCAAGDSLFFTHAADFSLYAIGRFDTDKGLLLSFDLPMHLVDADEVVRQDG